MCDHEDIGQMLRDANWDRLRPTMTDDAPRPLAPTPPGAAPSVRATLAEARRVLDEDVTPGPWVSSPKGVWSEQESGGLVCAIPENDEAVANGDVLAAARRLL